MADLGDSLLQRALAGAGDDVASLLLDEFYRGYPVDRARLLLESGNELAIRTGIWIASELGDRAAPLVDQVVPLLTHDAPFVKFYAIDVLIGNAMERHGRGIATTIGLLRDAEGSVRWQATQFLRRSSPSQLRASLPFQTDETLRALTTWLAEVDCSSIKHEDIAKKLEDEDAVVRKFAVAIAARCAQSDRRLLLVAATSMDEDVKAFAQDELDLLDA